MSIVVILLSIYGFLESVSYGIYEYQVKSNKSGAVSIFILSTLGLVLPIFSILI